VSRSNPEVAKQTNSAEGFPSDLLVDVHNGPGRGIRERLEEALRRGIQSGRLVPGAPLPPTRVLASELVVSRSVVVEAYGNLKTDGYLEAKPGSGTRVRTQPAPSPVQTDRPNVSGAADLLSDRYKPTGFHPERRPNPASISPTIRLFERLPDPALFPRAQWLRHYRAALAEIPDRELTYSSMLGAPPLRAAMAAYLGRVRGIATFPERMLICSGFIQGLTLVCRALRRRGAARVAVEDPCYALHREAIARTGLEPVAVAVDGHGLDPDLLPEDVSAVLVAPAHSYPTGCVLAADRRRDLIAWACRTGAIVIEDDCDAEYRYDRHPIGALQGLAPDAVVYIGCASKTVTPALRLGWLAAPDGLIDELEREKCFDDMGSSLIDQLAFARFVDSGDFARHLRRVRPVYRSRRDATIDALATYMPDARWQGEAAGLHLHVRLTEGVNEHELAAAAFDRGALVEDGAWHWARPSEAPPSIVLGYGPVSEPSIRRGVAIIAEALRSRAF
jgi:GntR family transcriptional regulator / MocR family aminotransferase